MKEALKVDPVEVANLPLPDPEISNQARENLNLVIEEKTGSKPGAGTGAPKELEEGELDEQLEKITEQESLT